MAPWGLAVLLLLLPSLSACATVCWNPRAEVCFDCFDAVVTCSYEGFEVTEASCQECQARMALLDELCEAGVNRSRARVQEEMVCVVVDTDQ